MTKANKRLTRGIHLVDRLFALDKKLLQQVRLIHIHLTLKGSRLYMTLYWRKSTLWWLFAAIVMSIILINEWLSSSIPQFSLWFIWLNNINLLLYVLLNSGSLLLSRSTESPLADPVALIHHWICRIKFGLFIATIILLVSETSSFYWQVAVITFYTFDAILLIYRAARKQLIV